MIPWQCPLQTKAMDAQGQATRSQQTLQYTVNGSIVVLNNVNSAGERRNHAVRLIVVTLQRLVAFAEGSVYIHQWAENLGRLCRDAEQMGDTKLGYLALPANVYPRIIWWDPVSVTKLKAVGFQDISTTLSIKKVQTCHKRRGGAWQLTGL